MNCLQFCRWTVFNSVGELSSKCVSVNCLVDELSRFLLDSVLEQATQILLKHAEISMIMCNIYNSIPASHLVSLIISFVFVYMKMKVEFWCISRPSHTFVFWPDSHIKHFQLPKNAFYWWSNIPRHTETALYSIKYNKVYLEPRIEGYPLILSNLPQAQLIRSVVCYLFIKRNPFRILDLPKNVTWQLGVFHFSTRGVNQFPISWPSKITHFKYR